MDFELYAVLSQDVPLQQKFSPLMDKPKTFSINQQPEGKKGKHFLSLAMYVYKRTSFYRPLQGCKESWVMLRRPKLTLRGKGVM